jgi:hypothetical protein
MFLLYHVFLKSELLKKLKKELTKRKPPLILVRPIYHIAYKRRALWGRGGKITPGE